RAQSRSSASWRPSQAASRVRPQQSAASSPFQNATARNQFGGAPSSGAKSITRNVTSSATLHLLSREWLCSRDLPAAATAAVVGLHEVALQGHARGVHRVAVLVGEDQVAVGPDLAVQPQGEAVAGAEHGQAVVTVAVSHGSALQGVNGFVGGGPARAV